MSPNVVLNSAKKLFKFANIREYCFNREENHNKDAYESKVPINPTCASAVGYL